MSWYSNLVECFSWLPLDFASVTSVYRNTDHVTYFQVINWMCVSSVICPCAQIIHHHLRILATKMLMSLSHLNRTWLLLLTRHRAIAFGSSKSVKLICAACRMKWMTTTTSFLKEQSTLQVIFSSVIILECGFQRIY